MRLKAKLGTSFVFMLVLMAILSFLGWQGIETMERQARMVASAQGALDALLSAQWQSLEFQIYKQEQAAKAAREHTATGRKALAEAIPLASTEEQARTLKDIEQFLQWYTQRFDAAQSLVQSLGTEHHTLTAQGNALSQLFNSLTGTLDSLLMDGENTESLRAALLSLNEAYIYFFRVRLEALRFINTPTTAGAKDVQKNLKAATDKILLVIRALRSSGDFPLAPSLAKGIDDFTLKFNTLAATCLKLHTLNSEMENALDKNTETMRELSAQAVLGITQNKESVRMRMFGMAAVAVLLAVGIALYLNSNVHAQLGRDPSDLAHMAQRVTNGDYNISDGGPARGVYSNLLSMVDALRSHITSAQEESQRAQEESEKANEAMRQAETAESEAKAKSEAMFQAATRLEEVVNIVTTASTQLAAQIAQSEGGASQQAVRVTETATAMEQMNSTVLEVARNAGTASKASAGARRKAEEGAHVVAKAVNSIQRVQHEASALKDGMGTLEQNAQAITEIMSVISDIADQTNLLALNAAIEAARAGEAGRGFAVVADEVRKLAEKTMISTVDVGNAIRAIQQSAEQSMAQVDTAVRTIGEATDLSAQSGQALSEIVSMVDSTADQVRAIATAAEEQSATSEQIHLSINEVNNIASETLRAMQEASGAVVELSGQAQALSRLIDNMKKA